MTAPFIGSLAPIASTLFDHVAVRPRDCPTCGRPMSEPDAPATVAGTTTTSRQAAVKVFPRTGTQRRRILNYLEAGWDGATTTGATDEELQRALRMSGNSVRPRRGELVAGGWVKDSGRTRATEAGDDAIVWVVTDAARAHLTGES